jgi:RpiR family transcriptional regulator, carbohydrate utilization regulator
MTPARGEDDGDGLWGALHARFALLPAKQQSVARLLIDDPAFVAFASAAELAGRAGVDAATVVRACQGLGYTGWRQLQEEVQRGLTTRPTFADRVSALPSAPEGDLIHGVFTNAIGNVEDTLRDLDRAAFDALVDRISGAGTVVVAAGGVSQGSGVFLASSLQVVGCRTVLVTGVGEAGPALGALGGQDLVLGVSLWRYLNFTVQALELAKRWGIPTAVITDSLVAPAALLADQRLVVHTATVGPRLGLTGLTALLEALIAGVAATDMDRSVRASRRASDLYADHVLGEPRTPGGGGMRWPGWPSEGGAEGQLPE